jgi:hypothetical protein
VSAYATTARLTLAQLGVPEKTNEITAIPELLDQFAETGQLDGALVTIDAMGCQVEIADWIVAHKADYVLALKGNQPTLETDVVEYRSGRRTRHHNHGREGPWPHRDPHLHRLASRRLDCVRPQLSGATALHYHQDDRQSRHPYRACRPLDLRDPHLHLVRTARVDIEPLRLEAGEPVGDGLDRLTDCIEMVQAFLETKVAEVV